MKEYGIDGVLVPGFIGEAVKMSSVGVNVLQNFRNDFETYERVLANMHDI